VERVARCHPEVSSTRLGNQAVQERLQGRPADSAHRGDSSGADPIVAFLHVVQEGADSRGIRDCSNEARRRNANFGMGVMQQSDSRRNRFPVAHFGSQCCSERAQPGGRLLQRLAYCGAAVVHRLTKRLDKEPMDIVRDAGVRDRHMLSSPGVAGQITEQVSPELRFIKTSQCGKRLGLVGVVIPLDMGKQGVNIFWITGQGGVLSLLKTV
jgi:hypothetical protein